MDDKQVGTEMKAALGELRQLAAQWMNASREWIEQRRQDMNPQDRHYGSQRDPRNERNERQERGYGEGYGVSGVQPRTHSQQPQDRARFGEGEQARRWARGQENDDDVRSQYDQTGQRQRSGYRQAASGEHEYGRGFDDRAYGTGQYAYRDDGESGYYAQGGEYSQGYGRERDPGRVYGPEDFSQRYTQGDVFADQGYGEQERSPQGPGMRGAQAWQERGRASQGRGSSWRDDENRSAYGSGRGAQDYGRGNYGPGYGGYASNEQSQRYGQASGYGPSSGYDAGFGDRQAGARNRYAQTSHRGRGPRGYTRSDERITEELNERLTDDHQLDASDISVSVSNGVATLSGSVEQRWLKHRAEDIAESCGGITDVRNDIRVRGSSGEAMGSSSSATGSESDAASRTRNAATGKPGSSTTTPGSSAGSSSGSVGSSTNTPGSTH